MEIYPSLSEMKQDRYSGIESPEFCLPEQILNMVKIMSHDVRGALVSMAATLKLLTRGHFGMMDQNVQSRLDELLSKTVGLIGMTEEYLGAAILLKENPSADGHSLDLINEIVTPVFKELSADLKDRHIVISKAPTRHSKAHLYVKGNRIWLKTIFRNLIQNAIRHGEKGGTISIDLEDHGKLCRITVFNSGEPISEEYRCKLFSKFGQVPREGTADAKGTGLGLYFVKKIVDALGGEIWYERKGDGSSFVLTLPRH